MITEQAMNYVNVNDIARLRAKVDWYEKGEQSTKYFFNLEGKNGQIKLWQKIRGLDSNLKYDIDEILDEQINVYGRVQIYPLMSLSYFLEPLSCRQ
jgi:hypothetical protein